VYYSSVFGPENVYVYDDNSSDGTFLNKDKIPNYELLNLGRDKTVERYGVGDYHTLWDFVVNKYKELLKDYKWVIHVDADDILVVDPTKHDLKSFILNQNQEWLRCEAYEVLHRKDEPAIDWFRPPILRQRKEWIRTSNLDKTCVVSKDHGKWVVGNHYVAGCKNQSPTDGLYLVHLHRIDYDNYRKKYLINDDSIKTEKQFMDKYKGYPLFWKEQKMDEFFYSDTVNAQWGAKVATAQPIPEVLKEAI
jgi:hypothetical protein